jgi:hypothetical protein
MKQALQKTRATNPVQSYAAFRVYLQFGFVSVSFVLSRVWGSGFEVWGLRFEVWGFLVAR